VDDNDPSNGKIEAAKEATIKMAEKLKEVLELKDLELR
jgi:hypothetical protein